MAEDTFNRDTNSTTENYEELTQWKQRGASEKRVGPQVPMNEQKPPGVRPEMNPRTRSNNSNTSS